MIKTAGQKIQGGEPQALCGGKSELEKIKIVNHLKLWTTKLS